MSTTPNPYPTSPAPRPTPGTEAASDSYAWASVVVAALTAFGGFALAFLESKYPCPLCFYQRAFALGVLGVMLTGLLTKFNDRFPAAVLALPVGFAGLAVALWHVRLEQTEVLICPSGLFGISSAPTQSAVMFGLLCVIMIIDAYQPGRPGNGFQQVIGAAAGGVLLGALCFAPFSNPQPKREIPAAEYEESPPKTCLPVKKSAPETPK